MLAKTALITLCEYFTYVLQKILAVASPKTHFVGLRFLLRRDKMILSVRIFEVRDHVTSWLTVCVALSSLAARAQAWLGDDNNAGYII